MPMPDEPHADAERTTGRKGLDTNAMIALRDSARVTVQQSIETISEGVTAEHCAVSIVFEARFRRALAKLLEVRDELY